MTDGLVIGAFLFTLSCLALVFLAAGVVGMARAWAADRERERRYAEDRVRAHRTHQDRDRYLTDNPERPE